MDMKDKRRAKSNDFLARSRRPGPRRNRPNQSHSDDDPPRESSASRSLSLSWCLYMSRFGLINCVCVFDYTSGSLLSDSHPLSAKVSVVAAAAAAPGAVIDEPAAGRARNHLDRSCLCKRCICLGPPPPRPLARWLSPSRRPAAISIPLCLYALVGYIKV